MENRLIRLLLPKLLDFKFYYKFMINFNNKFLSFEIRISNLTLIQVIVCFIFSFKKELDKLISNFILTQV